MRATLRPPLMSAPGTDAGAYQWPLLTLPNGSHLGQTTGAAATDADDCSGRAAPSNNAPAAFSDHVANSFHGVM